MKSQVKLPVDIGFVPNDTEQPEKAAEHGHEYEYAVGSTIKNVGGKFVIQEPKSPVKSEK